MKRVIHAVILSVAVCFLAQVACSQEAPRPIPYEEGTELVQMRPINETGLANPPSIAVKPPQKSNPEDIVKIFGREFAAPDARCDKADLPIWNGDDLAGGKGWGSANDKKSSAEISVAQLGGKDGEKCLSVNFRGGDWKGAGWNWTGWYDPDKKRTYDVSGYENLVFDICIKGSIKPHEELTFALTNSDSVSSRYVSPLKLGLINSWNENVYTTVKIPVREFVSGKNFDAKSVFELDIGFWGDSEISISVDNIRFDMQKLPDPRYLFYKWEAPYDAAIEVDIAKILHTISPLIYGVANLDDSRAEEANVSSRRLGGNQASPYNWKASCSNQGADWFFRNVKDVDDIPAWAKKEKANGRPPFVTIPMLSWLAKDADNSNCGFPVSVFGAQKAVNPTDPRQGDGKPADGLPTDLLAGKEQERFCIRNSPEYQVEFVKTLADKAGKDFWLMMDNEPMLWYRTHPDIEPEPMTFDSYWKRFSEYSEAILNAVPESKILGPCFWGWDSLAFCSADKYYIDREKSWIREKTVDVKGEKKPWYFKPEDRLKHGNLPFSEWFLWQCAKYEKSNGKKILHGLDFHYYPQRWAVGKGVYSPESNFREPELIEARLQSTRDLWDISASKDKRLGETWIKEEQVVIPRLQDMARRICPGLKIALDEYDWAGKDNISGAIAEAELLGIFAWSNLDIANKWGGLPGTQLLGFKLMRNYDGNKNSFGDSFLSCGSSNLNSLSVFASKDSRNNLVKILLINKDLRKPANVQMKIDGVDRSSAVIHTISENNLDGIEKHELAIPQGKALQIPPLSAAMIEFRTGMQVLAPQ